MTRINQRIMTLILKKNTYCSLFIFHNDDKKGGVSLERVQGDL